MTPRFEQLIVILMASIIALFAAYSLYVLKNEPERMRAGYEGLGEK